MSHLIRSDLYHVAKLIECIARGPLANERLEITDNENVKLRLKTPWHDKTTHLLFTPEEFLEKLSVLIPPPKFHLVRWGDVFAANAPLFVKLAPLRGADINGQYTNLSTPPSCHPR